MIPRSRPRLLLPAALVVASIGCPSGDDTDDTGAGTDDTSASASATTPTSDPSTPTDPSATATDATATATDPTDPTGSSTDPTGDTADTGSSSAADSGTDTGDLPTCTDLPDEAACQAESQCIYLPELGGCIRNCEMITDLTVCMMSPGCVVYEDTCGYEPIA